MGDDFGEIMSFVLTVNWFVGAVNDTTVFFPNEDTDMHLTEPGSCSSKDWMNTAESECKVYPPFIIPSVVFTASCYKFLHLPKF